MSLRSLRILGAGAFLSMGLLLTPFHSVCAADAKQDTENVDADFSADYIKRLSEAYGHIIQKNTENNPGLKLDYDSVIKGMQDGRDGKPSPMTEQEFEEAINLLQDYAYQKLAANNLKEADAFMIKNAGEKGIQILEPGKLQYIILQNGSGAAVVTENSSPVIKYTGKYADGKVFGSSEDTGGPITISLAQTIPGFRKGLVGMQQGEKRRLFIHPDLGYGTSNQLPPNSLLIFDVEVVDVKPPQSPKQGAQNDVTVADDVATLTYGPYQSTDDEAQDADDDSSDSQGNSSL